MKQDSETQMVADELAIRRLIHRYFNAIDTKNPTALASCFSGDARVVLFSGSESEVALTGNQTIADTIVGYVTNSTTNHSLCNSEISFGDNEGQADTFGMTHRASSDGKVFVRGLRYVDTLVRTSQGWRIRERVQHVLWQFNADSVRPGIPNMGPAARTG